VLVHAAVAAKAARVSQDRRAYRIISLQ
jgi:hypothetical protein